MKRTQAVALALGFSLVAMLVVLGMLSRVSVHAAPPIKPLQQAPGDCEVTTTADSGAGSLRSCIAQLVSGGTITFNTTTFPLINPATISLTSALPNIITDNVTIDGSNAGVILDGSGLSFGHGLVIDGASGVTIKGLQVLNFPDDGIRLQNGATNNMIGGSNATPGGACTGDCNLISGNGDSPGDSGVKISDSSTMSNTVSGNYIGTDINGTSSIPNHSGVILWFGANNNTIGGSTLGERNLISGNTTDGVDIQGSGTDNNTVSGNYIGTNVSGAAPLSNLWNGMTIFDRAQNNIVGGNNATAGGHCTGECNLISGNDGVGIRIAGFGGGDAVSNTVSGNYIGTDFTGTSPVPNEGGVDLNSGTKLNLIGGDTDAERNLISGNTGDGVSLGGVHNNVVVGNYIGTDASGLLALGNTERGIGINEMGEGLATTWNTIEGNVIGGNGSNGIDVYGHATEYNIIRGNYIGTGVTGSVDLGNGSAGVWMGGGAKNNTIGGSTSQDRNILSGNDGAGISIGDWGTMSNTVTGNYIGTDVNGTVGLGNDQYGVVIYGGAQRNTIGGTTEGERNIVSGNGFYGVLIWGNDTDQNTISGNYIGTDVNGSGALGNGYYGVYIGGGASTNTTGGPTVSDGNVIAYHDAYGIYMYGTSTLGNTISHNNIYSNAGLGIELVDGANGYMFPPVFTEVSDLTVKGVAVPNATIEVFSDDEDEGRWFHGSVTADAAGYFTFTAAAPFTGTNVTATATDANGNTSEFSSPYAPSRDVVAAAIYAPQLRQQIDVPLTPLVRVGNGGTMPETFAVTAVITHAGTRVYEGQQTVTDLAALHYRTLSFTPWTPTALGDYTFEVMVHPIPSDDDPSNDRLTLHFQVADDRHDLWSRDNPTDAGSEPSIGAVWQSPDLWVRNTADGLTEHQDPINNITNTVYVRVRNRGTLTATDATVTVYWHPPALAIGQSWWELIGTATVGEIAPGEVYTAAMYWQPQITGILTEPYHTCLIDVISSTQDPAPLQWDVRGSNNIEQRNVDIISQTTTASLHAASSTAVSTTFSVGNPYAGEQLVDVIIDATRVPAGSEVRLDLGELFGRWQRFGQGSLTGATVVSGTTQAAIPGGSEATIGGLPLAGEELIEVVMEVGGLNGRRGEIDVSERIGGEVLGGISVQVVGRIEIFLPMVMRDFSP